MNELPILNYDLIWNLIAWAEEDEKRLIGGINLADWGQWNQSTWAGVTVPDDLTHEDGDGDVSVLDVEALQKAIRNGACQTAYCMAGQAVVQEGYRLHFTGYMEDGYFDTDYCVQQRPTGRKDKRGREIMEDVPDARPVRISTVARGILGLNEDEADRFFGGDNEIEDLKNLANEFCEYRGLPPMFPTPVTPAGDMLI